MSKSSDSVTLSVQRKCHPSSAELFAADGFSGHSLPRVIGRGCPRLASGRWTWQCLRGCMENGMAVCVNRGGTAVAVYGVVQHGEIASGVFLETEEGGGDLIGRVVDRAVEHEAWPRPAANRGLASIWRSSPRWGMRSRRRRWRRGRRVRGLRRPSARRIRRTVGRERTSASCAASISVRC